MCQKFVRKKNNWKKETEQKQTEDLHNKREKKKQYKYGRVFHWRQKTLDLDNTISLQTLFGKLIIKKEACYSACCFKVLLLKTRKNSVW